MKVIQFFCNFAALKFLYRMTKKIKEKIIANPMYDVVFKTLMQADLEFAKYFVGTILGVNIVDIVFAPQEYTYYRKNVEDTLIKKIKAVRMDFVATILTKEGEEKKVLIEIQQSEKPLDVIRFSGYIGKHYIHRNVEIKGEEKNTEDIKPLPIVVIYLLGYQMPSNSSIAIKINRSSTNILTGKKVKIKEKLVEILTHDAYFIQVSRLKPSMYKNWENCSELLKLLSLFEQNYFVDKNHTKNYYYNINSKTHKILYKMLQSLERIAADPHIRRIMDEQEIDELEVNLLKNRVHDLKNAVSIATAERDNAWSERDNAWSERDNAWSERDSAWSERDNAWSERDNAWSERDNAWSERDNAWSERDKALAMLYEYQSRFGNLNLN